MININPFLAGRPGWSKQTAAGTGGAEAPLLAVRGITKRFGAFTANDNITLGLTPGEVHALLGENGAGKSTLVKMLYGLLAPTEGEILWQGAPIKLANPNAARALGIGMVFQHFSLFDNLTVAENIALVMPTSDKIAGRAGQDRRHFARLWHGAWSRTGRSGRCRRASASASKSLAACCRTPRF